MSGNFPSLWKNEARHFEKKNSIIFGHKTGDYNGNAVSLCTTECMGVLCCVT